MAKSKKKTAIPKKKTSSSELKKSKVSKKGAISSAKKRAMQLRRVKRIEKPEPAIHPKSLEPGYGKKELEYFKQIILEKRKEILEDLETFRNTIMDSTTGEYTSENPSYSLHMEQGTDTMEREKTFLFASREGKFLNYLDDALMRIEKGIYGRCTVCGKLIEKERLEAVPHAQMCVACKNSQK